MNIPGDYEDRKITPAVWEFFDDFWGDKAYRKADFVEGFEALVRSIVVTDLASLQRDMRACDGTWSDEFSSREIRDALSIAASVAKGEFK